MAHAVQLTIGTSNKVTINYQSQEVSVSLTYDLERDDVDVLAAAREKANEVAAVHHLAWEQLRDARVNTTVTEQRLSTERTESEAPQTPTYQSASQSPSAPQPARAEDGVAPVPITSGQVTAIQALVAQAGWSQEQMRTYLSDHFGVREVKGLSPTQAAQMLLHLQREERVKVQARSQTRRTRPNSPSPHSDSNGHI